MLTTRYPEPIELLKKVYDASGHSTGSDSKRHSRTGACKFSGRRIRADKNRDTFLQVSSIGRGICVLVGVGRDDNAEDVEYVVRKLLNLRLFANPETSKAWDKSVKDLNLEVLCVSQVCML